MNEMAADDQVWTHCSANLRGVAGGPRGESRWLQFGSVGLARAERHADLFALSGRRQPVGCSFDRIRNLWNKTIAVVDKYFDIESENRLARTIKTQPQMGATIIEPWALDSPTIEDRIEASLQTIRRVAIIHIDPAPTGGFLVKVEVDKFLEDMAKPASQPAGRAVFTNDFPVNRTREIVGPVPAPLGWIRGDRDRNLEQAILAGIRDELFL